MATARRRHAAPAACRTTSRRLRHTTIPDAGDGHGTKRSKPMPLTAVRTLARVGAALLMGAVAAAAEAQDVRLLGTGTVPGNTIDDSGLGNLLEDGVTPNNQVGGLGSALTYAGVGNVYLATPDRGPADGTTT